jgi:two-component system sensor histidine kinase YesM
MFFKDDRKVLIIMEIKGSKQLYHKLFFIYTAILVCAISALVIFFLNSTKNRFLEQSLSYTEMMSESAVSYLEDTSDIAEYIHEDLYNSGMELSDALHYMTDEPDVYLQHRLDTYIANKTREYKGIEHFFQDAFQAYGGLNRITLFSYGRDEITEYTRDGKSYRRAGDAEFKKCLETGCLVEEDSFAYLKEIRDPSTMQVKGCMILRFKSKKFESIRQYYSRAELIVYHEAGTAVYDSSQENEISVIVEAEGQGTLEDLLGAYVEQAQRGEYHIVSYLEKKRAAAIPLSIVVMFVVVGIAVMALGQLFVRYHLQQLAKRLNRILDGMTKVMDGDLDIRIPTDKNGDELDVIAQYFNEMCVRLDGHIKKQYLAEIEQKNAEMDALQSQINPHFLYNTLEAVRMKAICNGDREVGKMLYSLAVTFRAQIKEADIITLAQELHYCKKYMELFEFRYQNQFQASVECPEEYLKTPIIKFVLQPVIENYFIHGIRLKERDNFVRITVEKDDGYRIIVEDNGRGMPEEAIAKKNRELEHDTMEKHSSIGIANVNRRLKAVYGKEYGIRLEAREGGGLRVILRFKPDGEGEGTML